MSHSLGFVLFGNRQVCWYEFNGSVNVVVPRMYWTPAEVSENWRSGAGIDSECTCLDVSSTPCLIYTTYGYGSWWMGEACRECMLITKGISGYDGDSESNGDLKDEDFPTWVKVIGTQSRCDPSIDPAVEGHQAAKGLTTGTPPFVLPPTVPLPEMLTRAQGIPARELPGVARTWWKTTRGKGGGES